MAEPQEDSSPRVLFVGKHEDAANAELGRIMRYARLQKDLTAAELASAVEVSPAFVRGIERGAQAPSAETATKILERLGLRLSTPPPPSAGALNGPDLKLENPETGEVLLIEFKAARRGDTRRWSLDRLVPSEQAGKTSHLQREVFRLLNEGKSVTAIPRLADQAAPQATPSQELDDIYARLVRRLAVADPQTLLAVEHFLDQRGG